MKSKDYGPMEPPAPEPPCTLEHPCGVWNCPFCAELDADEIDLDPANYESLPGHTPELGGEG